MADIYAMHRDTMIKCPCETCAINQAACDARTAIVGAEHILNLLPAGTHEYAKFIKPSEMASWLRSAGLVMEGMTGLLYNPLSKRYWLDENDVSVNYMMRAVKPA